ncbi:MAG: hypothetical protein M3P11_06860 [Actinomycetota bacterium]|nr:hypothetical protein [Actinomycetota bacterium]
MTDHSKPRDLVPSNDEESQRTNRESGSDWPQPDDGKAAAPGWPTWAIVDWEELARGEKRGEDPSSSGSHRPDESGNAARRGEPARSSHPTPARNEAVDHPHERSRAALTQLLNQATEATRLATERAERAEAEVESLLGELEPERAERQRLSRKVTDRYRFLHRND